MVTQSTSHGQSPRTAMVSFCIFRHLWCSLLQGKKKKSLNTSRQVITGLHLCELSETELLNSQEDCCFLLATAMVWVWSLIKLWLKSGTSQLLQLIQRQNAQLGRWSCIVFLHIDYLRKWEARGLKEGLHEKMIQLLGQERGLERRQWKSQLEKWSWRSRGSVWKWLAGGAQRPWSVMLDASNCEQRHTIIRHQAFLDQQWSPCWEGRPRPPDHTAAGEWVHVR